MKFPTILGMRPVILLAAAVILTLPATRLQAATTPDGVEITTDRSTSESLRTVESLRALDRQITTLFRVSGRGRPVRCQIRTAGALPKGEVHLSRSNREWVVTFNDRDGDWLEDFAVLHQLVVILLDAKTRSAADLLRPPADPALLPGWVTAGIAARLEGMFASESFFRHNRWLPVLRALSETGSAPDFEAMRQLNPALLSGAAMRWYRELSRVLLDLGHLISTPADNALLDYCLLSLRGGAGGEQRIFMSTLGRAILADALSGNAPEGDADAEEVPPHPFLWNPDELPTPDPISPALTGRGGPLPALSAAEEKQLIQRQLTGFMEQLAYHDLFPRPARLALERYQEAARPEIPILDEAREPTGETFRITMQELPGLLLRRPDAQELKFQTAERIQAVAAGAPSSVRRNVTESVRLLMNLPVAAPRRPEPPPSPALQFEQSFYRLGRNLERRWAIEAYLEAYEMQHLPPREYFADLLREFRRPTWYLTPREASFVQEAEAAWLQE